LDGILLANALHFVRNPDVVLARLAARVRPDGRVVVVEYDGRPANPLGTSPHSDGGPPRLGGRRGPGESDDHRHATLGLRGNPVRRSGAAAR
ncbi:MAG: hypothetical protein ACREMV_06785, partial [Gemmatimonadales bacterium]